MMEEKRESTLGEEEVEKIRQADANVKTMEDFTSPEVLYKELEIPSVYGHFHDRKSL